MQKLKISQSSKYLALAVCVITATFFAACGVKTGNLSSGQYWSFIDGSKDHYSESADPVGANLKIDFQPSSEYLEVSHFDVYMEMQSGPTKELRLYPLIPDNVEIAGDDSVRLIATRAQGLDPESDNGILKNKIQSIEIKVTEQDPGTVYKTGCSVRHETQHVHYEEKYSVDIDIYDIDILVNSDPEARKGHMLGTFEGKIFYRSPSKLVNCGDTMARPSTGIESGKGMYQWLRTYAADLAAKKAQKTPKIKKK